VAYGADKTGTCAICGACGPLSFEHVPPERAFNNARILQADVERMLGSMSFDDHVRPRGKIKQRGAGGYTLCAKCNNDTGAWYGTDYVHWAAQGMEHVFALRAGTSLSLPFHILPQRVFKQIVCMFASVCGPSFFAEDRSLTRLVLNRDASGFPGSLRLYCYYLDPRSAGYRQSGIAALGLTDTGEVKVFAEMAFPPFGYILTVNSPPPAGGATDITFFAESRYNDYRSLFLSLPMLEVNTMFPGDFRPMSVIQAQFDESVALMPADNPSA